MLLLCWTPRAGSAAAVASRNAALTGSEATAARYRVPRLSRVHRGARAALRLVRCRIRRRPREIAIFTLAMSLLVASVVASIIRPTALLPIVDTVPVGGEPNDIGVNPVTGRVYVANLGSDSVTVLDGAHGRIVASVPVRRMPIAVGVNATTNRVYVANSGDASVSILDGRDNRVLATVPVGSSPRGIAVDLARNRVYVASAVGDRVWVIDGATNAVLDRIAVGPLPEGIALDPGAQRLYATSFLGHSVTIVDTGGGRVLGTVRVGAAPRGAGVDLGSHRVYVANYDDGTVSVLDGITGLSVATLVIGGHPVAVAVEPVSHRVYVTRTGLSLHELLYAHATPSHLDEGQLAVLDGPSGTVVLVRSVGQDPRGVAVDPATYRVYVANSASNSVSILQDQA